MYLRMAEGSNSFRQGARHRMDEERRDGERNLKGCAIYKIKAHPGTKGGQ